MDERAMAGALGLAMRAGQLLIGTGRCVDSIRQGVDLLVLVDEQVSQNTRKRLTDSCAAHRGKVKSLPSGFLEGALGRCGIMVAGVAPGGLRDKMDSILNGSDS